MPASTRSSTADSSASSSSVPRTSSHSSSRRSPAFRRIAPATTPDVRFPPPPPLRGSDLSAALAASTAPLAQASSAEQQRTRDDDDAAAVNVGMLLWGWGLLAFSVLVFVVTFWSIAIGPFVDTSGVPILDALAKDTHYKYLVVFLVPVTLYAVIINWWGLKIFRHA